MRQSFLIALSLLFIVIWAGLTAETIRYSYDFSAPEIVNVENYNLITFDNMQQAGVNGEPSLPYFPVRILLPAGKIATDIIIEGNNRVNLTGSYQLYPRQQSRPLSSSSSGNFLKNEAIYHSDAVYPARKFAEFTNEYMNGYTFLLTTITPVEYIPASGNISYFTKLTLTIQLEEDRKYSYSRKNLQFNSKIEKKIRSFAQNPEMLSSYANLPAKARDGEYEVLIITGNDFEDSFQDMINLNRKRGFICHVVTISEINSTMAGQDIQEKMRNYIIQEYQNNAIEHVILAGDCEIVPYRGFYCYVQSGSGYVDNGIPSDLYFAALDGSWDDDGDGIWGEIGEDDLLPELSVSRLPFNTQDELFRILNKSMMYQTQPVVGELNSPLLAGENLYNNPLTWGGDYLDLLIGYHDDNGYETNGIPIDDDYLTMYDRDLGSWSGMQLVNEINEGHSFVYHSGHSNYGYCMRLEDWQITNTNFSQVNGVDHNFSLIYSHGCNAGGFDVSDCIAEYMVTIDNFAAVYIGSSRYGWFNEGQTEGPSAHLNREFCDALYDAGYYLIGEANMDSKTDTAPWVTAPGQWEEGALRWTFYATNVLGDGLIPVWTAEPLNLTLTNNPVILLGDDQYEVLVESNGNPIEDVNCVLIQNNEFIGKATTDATGLAIIDFDATSLNPGEISLFVSGNNCLLTEYVLQVVPAGIFVQVSDYTVQSGNDDVLEFGENVLLSLTLQELGNVGDVHNTEVIISENDDYITLNDNSEPVGTITSGSVVELTDAFDFDLSNDVPDNHEFTLEIEINSDEGSWQSQLNLIAYAADIHLENVIIDDGENGILDPGEAATMQMMLMNNGGADAYNVNLNLQTSNPYVSLQILPYCIDSLNSNTNGTYSVCDILLDDSAPAGEIVSFDLEITADNGYFTENDFDLLTGVLVENFETGDFSLLDWTFAGEANWEITDEAFEGNFSAKSGSISNNDESTLEIQLNIIENGEISFWKKVSSEEDYDFLTFYVDNQLLAEWSGEDDWSEETYAITTGLHTFRWTYSKDQAVSNGNDCGWIDYITFPPAQIVTSSPENITLLKTGLLGNYPNPFNPATTIDFIISDPAKFVELFLYNIKGQKIKTLVRTTLSAGEYSVTWNGKDEADKPVASGVYFYRLAVDGKYIGGSKKMLMLK